MSKTSIATDWREAKKQAVHIGHCIDAEVLQGPNSEKIVLHSGKRLVFSTWYAAYSYCYRIFSDTMKYIPVAQEWIGPIPNNVPQAERITVSTV